MTFEISEPLDTLTDRDRADLLRFLFAVPKARRSSDLTMRAAIEHARGTLGEQSVRRGWRVWRTLQAAGALTLPAPPRPAAWRVWRLRVTEGWKYAALAASDSPARASLGGRNVETRHQQALAAVEAVSAFRAACDASGRPWWFATVEQLMRDEPADPAADAADDEARGRRLRRVARRAHV